LSYAISGKVSASTRHGPWMVCFSDIVLLLPTALVSGP
jgi:hypothetical protein